MDKEEFEKILKEAKENAPPMFHPVHMRDKDAWFPSNETGSIASIISHTWEDIQCLFNIRQKAESDYEKKLLFKYIVIELRSVIEQLEKLQSIIFNHIKEQNSCISKSEAEEIKILFKKYHFIKKNVEKDLIDIRNKIGAHRDNQSWINIMDLWDKLSPEMFKPLFVVIPELFELIIKLNIYDWNRILDDGSIEFCQAML